MPDHSLVAVSILVLSAALGVASVLLFGSVFYLAMLRPMRRAKAMGVSMKLDDFIGMQVARVNPNHLFDAIVLVKEAGIVDESMTLKALTAHTLAGGDVKRVAVEMANLQRYGKPVPPFSELAELELAAEPPFAE